MPSIQVTPDNFARAETDTYFRALAREGGFGGFQHHRELVDVTAQTVVRSNRDTLYSSAVFDLDAGPVTVTLPPAGTRFRSLLVIDEDHYAQPAIYDAGRYTFTREQIGTRYVSMIVRTFVDPTDPDDLRRVHALQDAIAVEQPSPGRFDVPDWEPATQRRVREALAALGETMPDSKRTFGPRDGVDPVRHLIGTAVGWGGNPEQDAAYFGVTPVKNDGTTIHRLTVRDVPVDGFWSISVYNAKGFFEPNALGAYSLNGVTAKRNPDTSVTVQFGGCDGAVPNCLPITPGWNYTVRLYRPRAAILSGAWKFPEAQPVP